MKVPDFESPSGDSLSKSANFGLSKWIFDVKNHPNLWFFFSFKNNKLGAHFLLKWDFGNFNFKPLTMVKSGPIFDQAAKLGKASRDAYNTELWLIL